MNFVGVLPLRDKSRNFKDSTRVIAQDSSSEDIQMISAYRGTERETFLRTHGEKSIPHERGIIRLNPSQVQFEESNFSSIRSNSVRDGVPAGFMNKQNSLIQ